MTGVIRHEWSIETEDYETAVPFIQKAADRGDATGQQFSLTEKLYSDMIDATKISYIHTPIQIPFANPIL